MASTILDASLPDSVGFTRSTPTVNANGESIAADQPRFLGRKIGFANRPIWINGPVNLGSGNAEMLGAGVDIDGSTEIFVVRHTSAGSIRVYRAGIETATLSTNLANDLTGTANSSLSLTPKAVHVVCGTILFVCSYAIDNVTKGVYVAHSHDYGETVRPCPVQGNSATDVMVGAVPQNQAAIAAGITGYSQAVSREFSSSIMPVGSWNTLTDFFLCWTDYLANGNNPKGGQWGCLRMQRSSLGEHLTIRPNRLVDEDWDASIGQQHWHTAGLFDFGANNIFMLSKGDGTENGESLYQLDIDTYETAVFTRRQNYYGVEGEEKSGMQPVALVPMADGALMAAADLSYLTPKFFAPKTINDRCVIGIVDSEWGWTNAGAYYVGRDPLDLRYYPHKDGAFLLGGGDSTSKGDVYHVSLDGLNVARVPVGGDSPLGGNNKVRAAGRRTIAFSGVQTKMAELPEVSLVDPLVTSPGGLNIIRDPAEFDDTE
ncbi:MAG: hypothetical protein AAGL98_01470, partial [Planctomycetota bacterium]